MKLRLSTVAAALCLSLSATGARSGSAEAPDARDPEWLSRMLAQGWRQVQEGVLERRPGGGRFETFTYGPAGRLYMMQRLQERIDALKQEQRTCSAANLGKVITELERQLESAAALSSSDSAQSTKSTENADAAGSSEPTFVSSAMFCGPDVGANATAGPLLSGGPGTTASADAHFSGCAIGNAYSYAYARATAGTRTTTVIQEEPQYEGNSVYTSATASASGSLDCFSEAYARSWDEFLDTNLEVSDVNFQCVP